jgi:drug/metabolite transporter (DMT)-like permease
MQMAWGGLFLLIFSAANHEFSKLPSLWRLWDWRFALSMGYLILIASIVSFTAYIWLLAHEPAPRVASYAYVNPVVALALGAIFAHERPTLVEYAGTLLVLAAVCVTLAARSSARQVSVEVS